MTQKSVSIRAIVSIRGVTIRAYTVVVFKLFNKTKTKKIKTQMLFLTTLRSSKKKMAKLKRNGIKFGPVVWYSKNGV